MMRRIELLAPARTADIGIEAIRHGADAVYIGGPAFGARVAAANSVDDIARLVRFAHLYGAKVYVTLNTLVDDDEREAVERLAWQLHETGVDAFIIQDLRLLSLQLPPVALHASTQMDNRTPEQVERLAAWGFPQVVLARELTVEEIEEIYRRCPDTALEIFVHGALCVGRSGRCNASEALFGHGRSANRGRCAQVCRMAFDLVDDHGAVLVKDKHLLSLKDNCQINRLEELVMAGASSLKIEGRLKDADYVKNVTAAYSLALDRLVAKYPDTLRRASSGRVRLSFDPDVRKNFNRGFVDNVSAPDANIHTPKSMGEPVTRHTELHNGDGLCYMDGDKLVGFRLNNAALFRRDPRVRYFRNEDAAWTRMLAKPTAERRVGVRIDVYDDRVVMTDEDGLTALVLVEQEFEPARTSQQDNVKRQLSKLGDTVFEATEICFHTSANRFIPSSVLSQWRRALSDKLSDCRLEHFAPRPVELPSVVCEGDDASLPNLTTEPVMVCKYCIRRQLGKCLKEFPAENERKLSLRMHDGTSFRLQFDCKHCLMKVYFA